MNNQQETGSRDTFGVLWAIFFSVIALLIVFGILWAEYSQQFKNLVLTSAYYLRVVQLPFTFLFSDAYAGALRNLPNIYAQYIDTQYDDELISPLLEISFRSLAFCFAGAAVPRAIYLIINNERINFTRQLSLKQLIMIMREKYPRIKPTTSRWLLDEDARFGSLGSQLNPIDLIIHKGFIDICDPEEIQDADTKAAVISGLDNLRIAGLSPPQTYVANVSAMTFIEFAGKKYPTGYLNAHTAQLEHLFENIDLYHGLLKVDPTRIKEYYESTLGPRCQYLGSYIAIQYLPPIERSLWVLFMACIAQRKDLRSKINELLDQFARSFEEGPFGSNEHKIDLTGVDELYEAVVKESSVRIELARIAKSHGYYYTAFTELYTVAKEKFGTITTQDFRWLRITNRILFYSLNQVGLERARYEAAGVRSHYLAEKARQKRMGGRIAKPQVDSAVLNTIYALDVEEWTAVPLTYEELNPESPEFMKACWINNTSNN